MQTAVISTQAQTADPTYKHFAPAVPTSIKQRMHALAELIEQDFISEYGEAYGCRNTTGIYGIHVPGFIPHQDGGYEISELLCSDQDRSYHLTTEQSEYMDDYAADCWKTFCRDHNIDESLPWERLTDAQQDAYCDFESDWMEPALLRVELWCEGYDENKNYLWTPSTTKTIHIRVSLNYRDQPYYRTKYDNDLFSITLEEAEFLNTPIEAILADMKTNMEKVK